MAIWRASLVGLVITPFHEEAASEAGGQLDAHE